MAGTNGAHSHPQTVDDLSNLPGSDPLRLGLMDRLTSAEDQRLLSRLTAEGERLQADLNVVTIPSALIERLLAIPEAHPVATTRRWGGGGLAWKAVAAGIIVVLGLLGYYYWPRTPPMPVPLEAGLQNNLVQLAVSNVDAKPLIESSDPQAVEAALKAQNLGFAPSVLKPERPLDLLGGGVCRFNTAQAAFTRWRSGDMIYTLYQFDGAALGVPPLFDRATQNLPTNNVVLWPGAQGQCTWALVMDKRAGSNPFGNYGG